MKITSKFTDEWRLINLLTVEYPWSQSEIYQALESENYVGDIRAHCSNPSNPILRKLLDSIIAEIPGLFLQMCDQDQFKNDTWHLENSNQMLNNTIVLCAIFRDSPGFTTSIHLDSRMTVCSGMLFFNKEDNPDQSTTFYTSPEGNDPIRISSQYGTGWYSANTGYSYHCGSNNSLHNRYSIMFYNKLNLK
jgi:hypothetical protein